MVPLDAQERFSERTVEHVVGALVPRVLERIVGPEGLISRRLPQGASLATPISLRVRGDPLASVWRRVSQVGWTAQSLAENARRTCRVRRRRARRAGAGQHSTANHRGNSGGGSVGVLTSDSGVHRGSDRRYPC